MGVGTLAQPQCGIAESERINRKIQYDPPRRRPIPTSCYTDSDQIISHPFRQTLDRLGRLSVRAQERLSHALAVAKAGLAGNDVD